MITGQNGSIAYSTDGINWTTKAVGNKAWLGVTYGNNMFITVGQQGSIAYSTDGINWTTKTIGNNLGIVLPMVMGSTWNKLDCETVGSGSLYWYRVAYGNGKFVAVGQQTASLTLQME